MLKRIVLATDGSESAVAAAQLLGSLPLAAGTEVQVVCVIDPTVERLPESVRGDVKHRARRLLRLAEQKVEREGVSVHGALRYGDADHQLVQSAQEFQADVVVVGSRGLGGLEGFLLGSVARNVAKHAPCSVLIGKPLQRGLAAAVVATDGSANGTQAVRFTAELPLPEEASTHVVHVLRPQNPILDLVAIGEATLYEQLREAEKQERARAEELVEADKSWLESRGKHATTELRVGDPASEILAAVKERQADLLVFGSRGASLIQGLITGSVADRLLAKADCSILLVR